MMTISFTTSRKDAALINRIIDRVYPVGRDASAIYLEMDITACHANGCALDLERLLNADEFNFAHDVFGIRRHMDRTTGQLIDCFISRCARPKRKLRGRPTNGERRAAQYLKENPR